jgi:hypothetical protein
MEHMFFVCLGGVTPPLKEIKNALEPYEHMFDSFEFTPV